MAKSAPAAAVKVDKKDKKSKKDEKPAPAPAPAKAAKVGFLSVVRRHTLILTEFTEGCKGEEGEEIQEG